MNTGSNWSQNEQWPWSNHEEDILRRMYPSKEYTFTQICDKLYRSKGSIAGRARKLGLRRPK